MGDRVHPYFCKISILSCNTQSFTRRCRDISVKRLADVAMTNNLPYPGSSSAVFDRVQKSNGVMANGWMNAMEGGFTRWRGDVPPKRLYGVLRRDRRTFYWFDRSAYCFNSHAMR
ncbi:MAG: hypothetical protein LH702_26920 [Phormidesmis sp. CAN_BIN44]|nr:hypothetical protein [Phormidesmis sp. CAN_BIN44]